MAAFMVLAVAREHLYASFLLFTDAAASSPCCEYVPALARIQLVAWIGTCERQTAGK